MAFPFLNESFKSIKMSATLRYVARNICDLSTRERRLCLVAWVAAAGCVDDHAVQGAKPPVAAAVPIVDMTPSSQRPILPAVTPVVAPEPVAALPVANPVPSRASTIVSDGDIAALRAKDLIVPIAGVKAASLVGSFRDARGSRVHEALDIAAPRGTPVRAADDGTVLKLFTSRGGGLTIYVADPTKRFIYYYAHLDAYAPTLAEGQAVTKGQQMGTVGTTGNAPPNTPHLHFAILRNDDMTKWWTGTPIDPYSILRQRASK